jgi:hypothetical protein
LPEGELHMAPLLRRTAFAHVVLGLAVSSVMMVGFGVGGGRTGGWVRKLVAWRRR